MSHHAALKRAALLAVQRAVPSVTVHNHVVGFFVPVHVVKTALGLLMKGDLSGCKGELSRAQRVSVGHAGRFDVGIEFHGGLYACVEFKGPGDVMRPDQIAEQERMQRARIPHYVCKAESPEDIPAAVERLCAWAVAL